MVLKLRIQGADFIHDRIYDFSRSVQVIRHGIKTVQLNGFAKNNFRMLAYPGDPTMTWKDQIGALHSNR